MMYISTCTVSYDGYAKISGNKQRIDLLEESLQKLHGQVALATLPGGFLFGKDEEELEGLAQEVSELSKKYNTAIALGVDLRKKSTINNDDLVKKGSLPWYAVVVTPRSGSPIVWRQRSFNSKNYKCIENDVCSEKRSIKIKGTKIEIIMCGEIFNPKIRESLQERGINAAIDLGHTSGGFRVAMTMKNLASNGIQAYCSVHAERKDAMKHAYVPSVGNGPIKISTRKSDLIIGTKPRIEIKIWNIKES